MKKYSILSVVILFALILAACAPQAAEMVQEEPVEVMEEEPVVAEEMPMTKTIIDVAVEDGRFTTLAAALEAADLIDTLKGDGPFTVFAPTDDAFAALPEGTVEALLGDIPTLTNILLYHVAEGKAMASDVVGLEYADTLAGIPVKVLVEGDSVMLGNANVIITDVEADNGVIHVIDTVLLPPEDIVATAVADGRFTTLAAALEAAGLIETLQGEGPYTVFAPTDDAFAALPAGTVEGLLEDVPALTDILLYHVVEGRVLASEVVGLESAKTINGKPIEISLDMEAVKLNEAAQVVITDIITSNGVIHVIDAVLLPPPNIVEIAVADGRFTTLVAALQAAELVETLEGDGPFTVFAPTDDAFAKLPAGTVEALLEDIPALTDILLYHVVDGKVMAADVVELESAEALSGESLAIMIDGEKVMINESQVIIPDLKASNGVIHVIDSVLLPPQ